MDSANPRYPLLADKEGWRALVTDAVEAVGAGPPSAQSIQKHTLGNLMWLMLSDILIGETE